MGACLWRSLENPMRENEKKVGWMCPGAVAMAGTCKRKELIGKRDEVNGRNAQTQIDGITCSHGLDQQRHVMTSHKIS